MKMKKRLFTIATLAITASMLISGCGDTQGTSSKSSEGNTASSGKDSAPTGVLHDKELTLDIYDVASNYQGEQIGWFGKIVKDKFNLKLNIIAPQVAGDAKSMYQTRCAAGELGDIVILDNADMLECIDSGLIADIDISKYPNLMKYQEQIDLFNANVGDGTKTYAIPTEMNTNGPTAYVPNTVLSYPSVPWNLYKEAGAPKVEDLDGLLDLLKAIQDKHPTNDAGDKAYAISLWPDWDNTSIETVNQAVKWYGQEVNGSVLIGSDNSIRPLTDETGAYYKLLNFFYKGNQMGIVDPDSAAQDWTTVCDTKMKNGRVYLFWYSWQRGFWNTPERGEEGKNYMNVPISDSQIFQPTDYYYGSGRVWGVGSKTTDEEKARIMEFLDWLASDEGASYQHASLPDLIYNVNEDGTYALTDDGFNRFSIDIMVPDELGGGKWSDGNYMINQWIAAGVDKNSITGEPYDSVYWSSTIEKNRTTTVKEWAEMYGSDSEVEALEKLGLLKPVPSVNLTLAIDNTDISLIRGQCGQIICDTSWKMIFAKDDAEFQSLWDEMCKTLDGLGWKQLVEFDTEKYQPVIEARKAQK